MAREGRFAAIVHGCNCFCRMGAGIALQIRKAFPEAYRADRATPEGDRSKLGTISVGRVNRRALRLDVINAYTQFEWGGIGVRVDYGALVRCVRLVVGTYGPAPIGMPRIGAGLARGDWDTILEIITMEAENANITIVEYAPEDPTTPAP